MKKIVVILFTVFLNLTLFSCSMGGDDQAFLEDQIEAETGGDGEILPPPPPPPPGGNGGG